MNTNAKLIDVKNGGGKTEVFHVSCFLECLLMLRKGRCNRCIMQVFSGESSGLPGGLAASIPEV